MDGWIKYLSACVPALHDLGPHEDAIGQRCDFILVLLFSAVPGAHRTHERNKEGWLHRWRWKNEIFDETHRTPRWLQSAGGAI
jgi:hypothetical protein